MVKFRISFERDDQRPYPSDETEAPETKFEDNPRMTAEIAVEMANRPQGSGGSVIVGVERLGGRTSLILVEPGDSIAQIENELRVKSQP